jgi:hypothetical protein
LRRHKIIESNARFRLRFTRIRSFRSPTLPSLRACISIGAGSHYSLGQRRVQATVRRHYSGRGHYSSPPSWRAARNLNPIGNNMDSLMTFRFTKDAMEKLKINIEPNSNSSDSTIFEWFVGVFYVKQKKYYITTNAMTLYSVLSLGTGICNRKEDFINVLDDFFNQMLRDGLGKYFEKYVMSSISESLIKKTNNRSVLGSMNDMIFMAKLCLQEESIKDATSRINKSPMSYIKMQNPIDYCEKIIDSLNN